MVCPPVAALAAGVITEVPRPPYLAAASEDPKDPTASPGESLRSSAGRRQGSAQTGASPSASEDAGLPGMTQLAEATQLSPTSARSLRFQLGRKTCEVWSQEGWLLSCPSSLVGVGVGALAGCGVGATLQPGGRRGWE